MSFGSAASVPEGFARVAPADPCPCGSGEAYGECCRPLHRGEAAPSAERLMRSRYTAFVFGDGRYLTETWHPRTRPDDLDLDPATRWTRLEIVSAHAGSVGDIAGVVEFRAHWRRGSHRGVQHESSRFVFQLGRWWYLDESE